MNEVRMPAVVIPLDGSEASSKALGAAEAISRIMGAALHIVHVTDRRIPESQIAKRLHIEELDLEKYALHQLQGEVVESILELSSSLDAKMIVMSGQGETNNPEHLAGRTALSLMQHTSIPIMVIRSGMKRHPDKGWKPMKMLVPLDGSPIAACVMNQVFSLAEIMGTDIDILHIAMLGKKPPMDIGTLTGPRYLDYPQYDWPAWVDEFLNRFYAYLKPEAKMRLFYREGDPAAVTLEFAYENEEDIIALSWRGQLKEKMAGTVKGILRKTELPVLLIRI